MIKFLFRALVMLARAVFVLPYMFLKWLYTLIGHAYFARFLYGVIAFGVIVYAAISLQGYSLTAARKEEIFTTAIVAWIGLTFVVYQVMANIDRIAENDFIRSVFFLGKGGSARWSGTSTFSQHEYKASGDAPIYLGRTMGRFDVRPGGRDIGVDDERHLITIAASGAGKSVTVIWPNLTRFPYPDSVFVLDPKGEHAQSTSDARRRLGHNVVILDPFGLVKGKQTHGFNPLAHININSARAAEDIKAIADACVIPSMRSDATSEHFDALKQAMIAGVIAYVMATQPKQNHNLPFVYEFLMTMADPAEFDKLVRDMALNDACGDLPKRAIALYNQAGENEKGSIFTSTINSMDWVASPGMRKLLLGNDLVMSDLRSKKLTLYVCLDFEAMKPQFQGRFMRVVMNLAFEACRTTPLPVARSRSSSPKPPKKCSMPSKHQNQRS